MDKVSEGSKDSNRKEKEDQGINEVYFRIAEAFDRGIMRAPRAGEEMSQAFIAFLKIVYKEEEAELVQYLDPVPRFKPASQIANEAGQGEEKVKETLDGAVGRGVIFGSPGGYCLPGIPDILNIHHIYPEVKPEDLEAAQLYQQFFIKEGYYKYYEGSEEGTPISRSIPIEQAISKEDKILTSEEAHDRILNAISEDIALQPCPCRTRTEKMGTRECKDKFPIGSCIFFGPFAQHSIEHGWGKRVTKEEAVKYLDEMQELGLVTTTDNYMSPDPMVICSCCGCCCSMIRGRTRWSNPKAVLPSNFVPIANEDCVLCGTCEDRCLLDAITLDEETGRATADPEKCIGCGICTITCPQDALKLHRFERSTPFETSKELWGTIAVENKVAPEN